MGDHNQEGCGSWLCKLCPEPLQLLRLLRRCEGEVDRVYVVRAVHVAVESDDGDERVLAWQLIAVPEGRLGPARAWPLGVGKLDLGFGDVRRDPLVVVVAHDAEGRAVEGAARIHVFELGLPARVVDAARHGAVPAVAEHEQSLRLQPVVLCVLHHLLRGRGLSCDVFFVSPVPNDEDVFCL